MSLINFPILYIPNPSQGRPLFSGQIYVGQPDLDPTVVINQKQLNVIEEDGTVVPVAQPFILSAGGVPVYNGNPVRLDVDGNYSLKILSKLGAQVYYVDNVFEGQPVTELDLINDLSQAYEFATVAEYKAFATAFPVGKTVHLLDRGADFTVISGTGSATEGRIIASSVFSASIELIVNGLVYMPQFGTKTTESIANNTMFALEAIAYAKANKIAISSPVNDTYTVNQPLDFRELDSVNILSTILPDGDITSVILGGVYSNLFQAHRQYVRKVGRPATLPGIDVIGAYKSTITIGNCGYIRLLAEGNPDGGGLGPSDNRAISYSTFDIRQCNKLELYDNPAIPVTGDTDTKKWINENTFHLGFIQEFVMTGFNNHNGNRFFGGSFEGGSSSMTFNTGRGNFFYGIRSEGMTTPVVFAAGTANNRLLADYMDFDNGFGFPSKSDLGTNNLVGNLHDEHQYHNHIEAFNFSSYVKNGDNSPVKKGAGNLTVSGNELTSTAFNYIYSSDYIELNDIADEVFNCKVYGKSAGGVFIFVKGYNNALNEVFSGTTTTAQVIYNGVTINLGSVHTAATNSDGSSVFNMTTLDSSCKYIKIFCQSTTLGTVFERFALGIKSSDASASLRLSPSMSLTNQVDSNPQNVTTAEIEDISDPINTTNKYAGKPIYITSLIKPLYASGPSAGDAWRDAAAVAHSPAPA